MRSMTPEQFRLAIAALGLNQEEAGEFLGLSKRQGQRYAVGFYPVPGSVAMLLRLMIKYKIKPKDMK